MEAWAIATLTRQIYGHGNCGSELMIQKELIVQKNSSYENRNFPPVFIERKKAEKYLSTLKDKRNKKVVPITINGFEIDKCEFCQSNPGRI
jgi:uncharacterized protein YfeS